MFLLLLVALAAAKPPAKPSKQAAPAAATADPDAPTEDALRRACETGDAASCVWLARLLESGYWGERRPAGAVAVSRDPCDAGDTNACYVGVLTARAWPDRAHPASERALMGHLCQQGVQYACVDLALRAPAAHAEAFWAAGCAAGDGFACAVDDGTLPARVADPDPLPADFTDAIDAAGLFYLPPPGFEAIPPPANAHFAAQHAIRSTDGTVELRLRATDLGPMMAEFERCAQRQGCVMVHPNELGKAMALSTALNVAEGEPDGPIFFPVPAVYLEFNADWGLVYNVHPKDSFAPGYDTGQVIALHRDGVGDAIIIALGKSGASEFPSWSAAFHALRFAAPHGP